MSASFVAAAPCMAQEFGRVFSQKPSGKLATAFGLSWSDYLFLIDVKNPDERQFYQIESEKGASARKSALNKGGGDAAV